MDEIQELKEDLASLGVVLERKIERQESKVKRLKRDVQTDTGPDALILFWAEQELEEFKLFLRIIEKVGKLADKMRLNM